MIYLTADKARKISEISSQFFNWELLDEIEREIIRKASKGCNEAITAKFVHKDSFSILGEMYLEDLQSAQNQVVEAGYTVDVKETGISEEELGADDVVKIAIKVSW